MTAGKHLHCAQNSKAAATHAHLLCNEQSWWGGVAESHHICATVACKDLFERLVSTVIHVQSKGTLIASKHCHNDFGIILEGFILAMRVIVLATCSDDSSSMTF